MPQRINKVSDETVKEIASQIVDRWVYAEGSCSKIVQLVFKEPTPCQAEKSIATELAHFAQEVKICRVK